MILPNLFKRTQVRTALAYTVLFTVSVIVLFTALIYSLKDEIEEGIQTRVSKTRDALVMVDRRFGFEELVNVINEEADSVRDADSIFTLIDAAGVVRGGNVQSVTPFDGWQILERRTLPAIAADGSKEDRFYAVWSPVSKGMLLVGRSDREARQSQTILMQGLSWGLLATALFALGSGVWLARRSQLQIDTIGTTLQAVSGGDFHRRVPVTGAGDDLEEVTFSVNEMLEHLQQLVENVNQASTDIAHDLKKPMMRLRQRLETMAEAPDVAPALRHKLEEALEASDSIVATFDALLNIGQLQAGDRRSRFSEADTSAILVDVIEAYEPVIQDEGYHLSVVHPLPRIYVQGDRELLIQMLANLIDNALRHCPKHTVISLALADKGDRVQFVITDSGPGIPSADRERVFRRFFRLEQARSSPGHGLGLSVVAAIVQLHKGKITLEDNAPGLRVVIDLPVQDMPRDKRSTTSHLTEKVSLSTV